MEVQHINIKLFAQEPISVDPGDAIPVFHRWIQRGFAGHLLIDVADYRHVPEGPGVILIAHEAHFALESTDGCFGLLYNRLRAEAGDTQAKLAQAYDTALDAARRLEQEPEFKGKLKFHSGDVEVIFNDRLLVPNTPESFATLRPEIERFFSDRWGDAAFELEHTGEPRDRLRVHVVVRQLAPVAA